MSQVIGSNQDGNSITFDWVKASSQTNTGVASPKPFDWTKLGEFIPKVTQTPVICKDGTTDFSLSSPNARYDNSKVCANNGGRAENQQVQSLAVTDPELLKKNMELSAKKDDKMKQLKYGIIAVVLVAGYFAYKKFKK
jgi:hypothetical protein